VPQAVTGVAAGDVAPDAPAAALRDGAGGDMAAQGQRRITDFGDPADEADTRVTDGTGDSALPAVGRHGGYGADQDVPQAPKGAQ
jgi:hypothetical protein